MGGIWPAACGRGNGDSTPAPAPQHWPPPLHMDFLVRSWQASYSAATHLAQQLGPLALDLLAAMEAEVSMMQRIAWDATDITAEKRYDKEGNFIMGIR